MSRYGDKVPLTAKQQKLIAIYKERLREIYARLDLLRDSILQASREQFKADLKSLREELTKLEELADLEAMVP